MKRDPDTDAPNLFAFARDYLHGYLPKARGLSPKSIQAYRISLECFLGYLTEAEASTAPKSASSTSTGST
jgi:integrase/recombinase XerD